MVGVDAGGAQDPATSGDDERRPDDTTGGRDPYATLGVPGDATDDEISRAYRRLAREHHPDANPGGDTDTFAKATDAYDLLRDPGRRRAHDRMRRARADAVDAAGRTRIPVRTPGHDRPFAHQTELHLTFEQAALGARTTIDVALDEPCRPCDGAGWVAATCSTCHGMGFRLQPSGVMTIRHVCSPCNGSGHLRAACEACHGRGVRFRNVTVTVEVPPGVVDGDHLAVRVPGSEDRHTVAAVARVAPHRYFARRGRDLTLTVPVTLAEAALGAVVSIPTLTDAVAIRIPPATPPGRVLRVRGRGIPFHDGVGDLLVTVEVVVPDALNDAQRAALEAFAAATESPRRQFESGDD